MTKLAGECKGEGAGPLRGSKEVKEVAEVKEEKKRFGNPDSLFPLPSTLYPYLKSLYLYIGSVYINPPGD
jgi:hypothetical protein